MSCLCWRNTSKMYQYGMATRQSLGQLMRFASLRYHVHGQQFLQKHTLPRLAEQQKQQQAQQQQQENNPSKSEMNAAAGASPSPPTSSVFSSYTKDSYQQQQMNLKHLQHPQQAKQLSAPTPPVNIPYKIDWVFERLKNPTGFWYICSQIAIFAVGLFSKFVLVFMNKTRVYNKERLLEAVAKRPSGVPLVTVSNHHSCFDDPGLWGVLPVRYVCNTFKIRWSMAANDICFTNKYHSLFFMLGKCIPVIRGIGVYQDAVNLCIQKAKLGHWVHVFPEGKVNMTKEEMRLKWGVGRIIYESTRVPVVIPMWHEGMDEVLPNVEPYILKWGKRVTLNIGKPIDMNDFINDLKCKGVPETEARKLITDKIQDVFHNLRLETEELHKKND